MKKHLYSPFCLFFGLAGDHFKVYPAARLKSGRLGSDKPCRVDGKHPNGNMWLYNLFSRKTVTCKELLE